MLPIRILDLICCMNWSVAPTIFNWSKWILVILKDELIKFHQGEIKQFDYGAIVALFLERVPLLLPHVPINRLEP